MGVLAVGSLPTQYFAKIWLLILSLNYFTLSGPYYIETSPLSSGANQLSGFFMIGTLVMTELILSYSKVV